MESKVCCDCGIAKDVSLFDKRRKGLPIAYCKACRSIRRYKQYHSDPVYRARVLENCKKSRKNNPEKAKQTYINKRKKNPELYRAIARRAKSKPENKLKRNRRLKEQRARDKQFRLQENLRSRLYKATVGLTKAGSAVKDLGCNFNDLKVYLESKFYGDMSWDNYGSYWAIDHIIPLASFDLTDKEQFLRAAHYSNLQPLTKVHNQIKLDKVLTEEEMQKLKEDKL